MMQKIKIAIFTNVIPTYREGFYREILKDNRFKIDIYCHKSIEGLNVKTINEKFDQSVVPINYKWILNRKILWQKYPIIKILRNDYDLVISDGNPRHFSQALLSIFLKIIGTKVAIWSTVHSHRNNSSSKKFRLLYWKIFDYFLMYVERDIDQMKSLGFKSKLISSINNGLDQNKIREEIQKWDYSKLENWKKENGLNNRRIILGSSRVVPGKFDNLILAVDILKNDFPDIKCVIVGDGPYLDELKQKAFKLGIDKYIYFAGELYDESKLAPWFLSALVLVHPAPIGLTLMHSLGYGLPVITYSDWETHGPEFSVFKDGHTGFLYNRYDNCDLANKIKFFLNNESLKNEMSTKCIDIIDSNYNTDKMANNFIDFCTAII